MSLEIAPVIANDGAEPLPTCTPSLMPFHISYTGPAPISRYFRPKPAPAPPSLAALSARSSSSATLIASSSSTSVLSETQDSQSSLTAVASSSSTSASVGRLAQRFVAAFRGRQMYGQVVDVPNGYGGLVLRAPLNSGGKHKEDESATSQPSTHKVKPKSKTRAATRQSKLATRMDGMVETGERGGDRGRSTDLDVDPPRLPVRKLVPSATFDSFMLWTPDIPLDEGRDEYARALVEWTRLAAEIHSYDEQP